MQQNTSLPCDEFQIIEPENLIYKPMVNVNCVSIFFSLFEHGAGSIKVRRFGYGNKIYSLHYEMACTSCYLYNFH